MHKLKKSILPLVLLLIAGGIALGGSQLIGTYLAHDSGSNACAQARYTTHVVTIFHNQLNPTHIDGHLCDRLTIRNDDELTRLIAFGPHDNHTPYDGVTEKVLRPQESLTVTLRTLGTYTFHDHLHDQLVGTFTVSQ